MTSGHEIRGALRDSLPLLVALVPFGMVYGAFAIDAGLTIPQTLGFSAFVYAGASQLLALQLIALGTPLWGIALSVFALNIRHVLYSASIGRRMLRFGGAAKPFAFFLLVDPLFAAAEARTVRGALTKSYYFTYGLVLYTSWFLSSLLGALFGGLIEDPVALGLDMVLPIYFLAQTMAFRGRGNFLPVLLISAGVSVAVYLTLGSPWHVTIGGGAGILYAMLKAPTGSVRRGGAR